MNGRTPWHQDGLDAALARATEAGRPLLVRWTASWCPPCQELRLEVFDGARFAALAPSLELLSIDGDAPGAQRDGERLGASFYPTCLLLDPHGRELLRLSGGRDAGAFCDLIARHAEVRVPLQARIRRVEDGRATDEDLDAFAAQAWSLDGRHHPLPGLPALLEAAWAQAAHAPLRTRMALLVHWLQAVEGGPARPPPAGAAAVLLAGLHSAPLAFADVYALALRPARLDLAAPPRGTPPLRQALRERLASLADDPMLGPTQRLILLYGRVQLAGGRVDPALAHAVRATVHRAQHEAHGDDARLSVLNMAAELLRAGGDGSGARALLQAEAERSAHAAYFLQALAGLHEAAGDRDRAQDCARRAYERTPPGPTRFARGLRYLRTLPTTPQDAPGFERALRTLLSEVAAQPAPVDGNQRRYLADLFALLAQRDAPAPTSPARTPA
ncbi:thioredoxin family protein [Luteimonas sp. Y-2-2-4F]|nr:thioredoxin family protein [Luteimonas sp. Y-2-2-4F]